MSEIVPVIEKSGLIITDIEVLRLHYAKTLAAWRRNFEAAWEKAAGMLSERFCRMWQFYLAGCEVGFRYHNIAVFQIQLAKRIDAVPLTRNYLYVHKEGVGTGAGNAVLTSVMAQNGPQVSPESRSRKGIDLASEGERYHVDGSQRIRRNSPANQSLAEGYNGPHPDNGPALCLPAAPRNAAHLQGPGRA